jgi:2-polyprenyl-3-methyl-5-hydroxy-6-metoxy-1,4-benzoquinol methylase
MHLLSALARQAKVRYFFRGIPKDARILEAGCGSGWLGVELARRGFTHYTGIDLRPPASIVGDIRNWHALGLEPNAYDVLAAFELIEHGDFFAAFEALLKPGGLLFLTSPVPRMDGFLRILENLRLNQMRTSPHIHLIAFKNIQRFHPLRIRTLCGLAQWGIFIKPTTPA